MISIQEQIKGLSTKTLQAMVRECLVWRKKGKIEEPSAFSDFVDNVEDENFRGDMRAIDDFVILEAARRFASLENVRITSELAEQASQALADARRYGAGDWTHLEDQLNSIG